MKHIFLIYILVLIFFNGFGKNISEERAVRVASNFLYNTEHTVTSCSFYGGKENSNIYVVNFSPEGWALVAADENAQPVIGYSYDGYFDVTKVDSNVKNWLDFQSDQISKVISNSKWIKEWETLDNHGLVIKKSASSVDPLIKTKWDQGAGWNRFCPDYADGPDGKAYVGCVAVAMAQALYYLKFPDRPQGSKSYQLDPYGTISLNFDEEPAYNWTGMSLTSPDDYNARLLYNCAVAVEMDFGGDGSGAYTTRVPFAFQRYFGFTPTVQTISRYTDDNEWVALLKSELDRDNVLIYSGNPSSGGAGHAFNIDGYSASGYFHFNWGWSGSYNGYYSINDVAPGSSDFTQDQKAVIGISKPYWGPTDITLSNQSIKENMPEGTVVGDISITDYSMYDQFTIEVFGAPLFLQEGYAPAKFYEENMQLKSLEPLTAGPYPETATIRVTDSEGNTFEKSFEIVVNKVSTLADDVPLNKFKIYPNPADRIIYISGVNAVKNYRIIDITGKTVLLAKKYDTSGIDISSLHNGIYFLEFSYSKSEKQIQKIIINR